MDRVSPSSSVERAKKLPSLFKVLTELEILSESQIFNESQFFKNYMINYFGKSIIMS